MRQKRLEAPGSLGDRGGEHGLALLAELRPLGYEAEPVEVDVRAAEDREEIAPHDIAACDVPFRARDTECRRRLDDRARVLEDVLHRGADLVGVDQEHLVDVESRQPERLRADASHGDAVCELAHVSERHAPAGPQRAVHRVGVGGLDADNSGLGPKPLHVGGDAADEAAAADGDEDRIDRLAELPQHLHPDRALAGDHVRVVVRMHEREPAALPDPHRRLLGIVVGVSVEHDVCAERTDGGDLDLWGRHRHHDRRRRAEALEPPTPRLARDCPPTR